MPRVGLRDTSAKENQKGCLRTSRGIRVRRTLSPRYTPPERVRKSRAVRSIALLPQAAAGLRFCRVVVNRGCSSSMGMDFRSSCNHNYKNNLQTAGPRCGRVGNRGYSSSKGMDFRSSCNHITLLIIIIIIHSTSTAQCP